MIDTLIGPVWFWPMILGYGAIGIYTAYTLQEPFEEYFKKRPISPMWENFVIGALIFFWPLFLSILLVTTAYTALLNLKNLVK